MPPGLVRGLLAAQEPEEKMVRHRTLLVVVADGGHARFLRWSAGMPREERVFDSSTVHRRAAELSSDRPGTGFESASPARHAMEPRHDPHELAKEEFAKLVADEVSEAAESGGFDGVVLAAPARVLNVIRGNLDAAAAGKIAGVLRKDLVKLPEAGLETQLRAARLHPAMITSPRAS